MLLGVFVQVEEHCSRPVSPLYGNLMGWSVLILRASRSFWHLFMSVSLLKRRLIRLLRPICCPVFLIGFHLIGLTIARVCFLFKSVCCSVWHGQRQGTWF